MGSKGQVLAALDTVSVNEAVDWAHRLDGAVSGLKLGLEFFLANGQLGYRRIAAAGMPIFLDLKLHDIPNTVAGAVKAIIPLQPSILTVHAGGGQAMMQAARDTAAENADKQKLRRPRIVGVTDPDSRRAAEMAARFGIPAVCRSLQELLDTQRPDVLHVLTTV